MTTSTLREVERDASSRFGGGICGVCVWDIGGLPWVSGGAERGSGPGGVGGRTAQTGSCRSRRHGRLLVRKERGPKAVRGGHERRHTCLPSAAPVRLTRKVDLTVGTINEVRRK
ncbi:hypothetical protein GCM10022232_81150 [Streptomyces plumbiresistens]|uniref:Uncharacterized protein n=1 Tax=Streptomyces plumbiresistens TaxID=511811 RepID=A0ABP7TB26_9ACTN